MWGEVTFQERKSVGGIPPRQKNLRGEDGKLNEDILCFGALLFFVNAIIRAK